MQIDLRTITIEPQRPAFDHLIRRFGNKPASRYQEGSYDIQPEENLHYRPTWAPEQQLYDTSISNIVMRDWHDLKDPRQFYYSTYTLTRARQQENAEANFAFAETRGLLDKLSPELRALSAQVLIPLRHAAWGANMNNSFICGYGYSVTFTQPCIYYAMDQLGIAQYLSRIGLLLGDVEALAAGKQAWQSDPVWQGLRRYVEDSLVVRDPFELFITQNLVLDGLLYPLVYSQIVDGVLAGRGANTLSLLTQFIQNWFEETSKWTDSVLRTVAAESDANKAQLQTWLKAWSERAVEALSPIASLALEKDAPAVLDQVQTQWAARLKKSGIKL